MCIRKGQALGRTDHAAIITNFSYGKLNDLYIRDWMR